MSKKTLRKNQYKLNVIELAENSLLKHRPDLFDQWDFDKNDELGIDIYSVTRSSNKKVWWICPDCKSNYDATINNRTRKGSKGCSYCSGSKVNHTNSLGSLYPALIAQWHKELNGCLTPYDVTYGSEKIIWWLCPKCKSSYDMTPNKRTRNRGCPYCGGYRVNHTNSLESKRPDLIKEWHQNNKIKPADIYFQSTKKFWWICCKGHEWEASLEKRVQRNQNCPYCVNVRVVPEENSINVTNPELSKLLLNYEDGFKFTQWSNKRVDWKCNCCSGTIKNKPINEVNSYGLSCPRCSPSFSFGERVMYSILIDSGVEFIKEASFEWSNRKRYDFYLPAFRAVVEVHGMQHYIERTNSRGEKTLAKEQENDRYKKEIAINNGIEYYFEIDARHSEIEHINNSIKESMMLELISYNEEKLESVVYVETHFMCLETWKLWNSGVRSTFEIARILKTTDTSVRHYLKRGKEIGKCDYDPNKTRDESLKRRVEKSSVKVVKLTLNGDYVETYSSISEAARENNFKSSSSISMCCSGSGNRKKAGGFRWMYKDDYDNCRNFI